MTFQPTALRSVVKQGNGVYPVLLTNKPLYNFVEETITWKSGEQSQDNQRLARAIEADN